MSNVDLDQGGRLPQILRTYLGPTTGWKQTDSPVDIQFMIDGSGSPPLIGDYPPIIIPDWLTIADWVILGDQAGSCVVDIWKVTLTQYLAGTIPTVANTITGSAKPTVSGAVAATSSTLTGWTTQINQNDVLMFNIDSLTTFNWINVILRCIRNIGPA